MRQDALRVSADKAAHDILDAVQHARGCGCPGCYREANRTFDWYNEQPKTT